MSDNKYKMFRNYMVNELGVTKEDIKLWTREAVKESADKFISGHKDQLKDVLLKEINKSNYQTRREIAEEVAKVLEKKVKIDVNIAE